MFKKLSVIGLGLIGGSLAKAILDKKVASEVVAFDKNKEFCEYALDNNIISKIAYSYEQLLENTECIIICVPSGSFREVLINMLPYIKKGMIITDVSSVKGAVADIAKEVLSEEQLSFFVPSHPIAGSEKSSVKFSKATLFKNKKNFITKSKNTNLDAIKKIKYLWEEAGSEVSELEIDEHDRIYAEVSHTPHLIAFLFMKVVSLALDENSDILQTMRQCNDLSFKVFSRIAGAGVNIWSDIFLENKKFILENIKHIKEKTAETSELLEKDFDKFRQNLILSAQSYNNVFKSYIENKKAMSSEGKSGTDNIQTEAKIFISKLPVVITYIFFSSCSRDNFPYAGGGFKSFTYPLGCNTEEFFEDIEPCLTFLKKSLLDFYSWLELFEKLLKENNSFELNSELSICKETYSRIFSKDLVIS